MPLADASGAWDVTSGVGPMHFKTAPQHLMMVVFNFIEALDLVHRAGSGGEGAGGGF